jgi:hypothetical protein
MVHKFIITLFLITGCTTTGTNLKSNPCPEQHTLVCEIYSGSHKDCWCEDNQHLRRILENLQQRIPAY